ncbi:hypothetical protein Tco_1452426, partial [Tanacetum coccineum]
KPTSLAKKKTLEQTLVTTEEPAKIPAARSQPAGVQIRDTLGVPDVSKADSSDSEYESWRVSDDDDDDDQQDDDYVPTDDDVDDEEYDHINKEMYDDVNVELKDAELDDEGKGDKEMTNADKVNAKLEEVNQEFASAQVQDEAQATTTAAPAQVASSSLSVSSNYVLESETLSAIHLRVSDLEKEVQELKQVDHSTSLLATIKSEVPTAIKEYLGTSLEDALYKALQIHTAEFIKEHSVLADVIEMLKHQQKPQKKTSPIRDHDSIQIIQQTSQAQGYISCSYRIHTCDEDAMDQGVAYEQKERKPADDDRDEDPPAGPDQGLKKRKTSKDVEP